ncbi:hypothetical protein A4A49_20625 [Nicotiana attenuata]|uniref:Uncharacterized protein n=1 Tax=Nicotiana attenuata TaxID=49451 RepID=A0A314LAD8_NICAT|nr:hypothetical protein A4A49_20625 [Nicotiana attenuata]
MERILANSKSDGEISTQQSSDEERVNNHLDQEGFQISHIDENASIPVGNRHEDARAVVTKNGSNEGENSENYKERRQESGANNIENYQDNEQLKEIVEEEESEDALRNDSEESDVIGRFFFSR